MKEIEEQQKKFLHSFLDIPHLEEKAPSEYLFDDTDNEHANSEDFEPLIGFKKEINFDSNKEKMKVIENFKKENRSEKKKKVNLYHSTEI